MRVALLEREHDLAVEHYEQLQYAITLHGAEARLDFESRLACEISMSDMLKIARSVESAAPAVTTRPVVATRLGVREEDTQGLGRIVSSAREMRVICDMIAQYAHLELPVLITGETGVGKELIARAIHEEGPRRRRKFVAINCAAISEGSY